MEAEARLTFSKAYDEQEEKDSNSNDNAIFKALIYKLGKKGPVNEIKIDLHNPQNNHNRRRNIIESLIKETGYIEAPRHAFNEFISESTLAKLKEQIERDYGIIQNILDHDQYFENPFYIQYIVDILDNIDELKNIIKTAGGKFLESRLRDCLDVFKSKWNKKITKARDIVTKIQLKDCSIRSMAKKLNEFGKIQDMMIENVKVIKTNKYYKELKDIICLNEGLHVCFDELYRSITDYLNAMINEIRSDNGSDTEFEYENTVDNNQNQELSFEETKDIDNDNYNYDFDYDYDKQILLTIQKCCLLKQHKNDKYIKRKFKDFEKLINEIMKQLQRRCDNLMQNKQALNASNVPKFIFIHLYPNYNRF